MNRPWLPEPDSDVNIARSCNNLARLTSSCKNPARLTSSCKNLARLTSGLDQGSAFLNKLFRAQLRQIRDGFTQDILIENVFERVMRGSLMRDHFEQNIVTDQN